MITLDDDDREFRAEVRRFVRREEDDMVRESRFVLAVAGDLVVQHLKGYIRGTVPPIRPGGPRRPSHPGNWGDRTGELADGYGYEVVRAGRDEQRLRLYNEAEHARYVEDMEGRFVLRGVLGPDGYLNRALKMALKLRRLNWRLG